ncbi:MAG: hypothetical protein WC944_09990 [Candidatus Cloacimonadaceae bacterium]
MNTILGTGSTGRTVKLMIMLFGIFTLSILGAQTWNISDVAPFPGGQVLQ